MSKNSILQLEILTFLIPTNWFPVKSNRIKTFHFPNAVWNGSLTPLLPSCVRYWMPSKASSWKFIPQRASNKGNIDTICQSVWVASPLFLWIWIQTYIWHQNLFVSSKLLFNPNLVTFSSTFTWKCQSKYIIWMIENPSIEPLFTIKEIDLVLLAVM